MSYRILIIDDDDLVGRALNKAIRKFGYETDVCPEGEKAMDAIGSFMPDIVLLDIYLKTTNGIDILKNMKIKYPEIPVIMITGYADVNIAVSAMKIGAYDFLMKPLDMAQLQLVFRKIVENIQLKEEVKRLKAANVESEISPEFFGKNKKVQKLVRDIQRIAKSDSTILLEGESGTGKEEFAKFVHQSSERNQSSFIRINCGSIPRELAESELFGHEKGAFTGAAQKTKLGKFELAHKGTLLLDEIGELSLDLQVKLLRVLQEKKFYRVGGEKEISVDVRVVAATNKSLIEEVKKGNFREDLFYRLNVAQFVIPPLRERADDIPVLVYSFLSEFSQKFGRKLKEVDREAIKIMQSYPWKGNIRELRNVLERAVLLVDENEETLKMYHLNLGSATEDVTGDYLLKIPANGIKIDVILKDLILKTLEITKGNQLHAARLLGLSRSKLRYRMEQLGIEVTKTIG